MSQNKPLHPLQPALCQATAGRRGLPVCLTRLKTRQCCLTQAASAPTPWTKLDHTSTHHHPIQVGCCSQFLPRQQHHQIAARCAVLCRTHEVAMQVDACDEVCSVDMCCKGLDFS